MADHSNANATADRPNTPRAADSKSVFASEMAELRGRALTAAERAEFVRRGVSLGLTEAEARQIIQDTITVPTVRAERFRRLDAFRGLKTPGSYWFDSFLNDDVQIPMWYCCPCGCGQFGFLPLLHEDQAPRIGRVFRLWAWNGVYRCPSVEGNIPTNCRRAFRLTDGVWTLCIK